MNPLIFFINLNNEFSCCAHVTNKLLIKHKLLGDKGVKLSILNAKKYTNIQKIDISECRQM